MPLGAPVVSTASGAVFEPIAWSVLPHWNEDDHTAAFGAFLVSARRLLARADAVEPGPVTPPHLLATMRSALDVEGGGINAQHARAFFETVFVPHRVVHSDPQGLLTGYYEPVIDGARERKGPFNVPVLRRPPDLVNLVAESERGAKAEALTHARRAPNGDLVPYATRTDIENGCLSGQDLELIYLADPVDAFFLHVQGSGRIRLPDGQLIRITYDGKNGHPYTSVGRYLIDAGLFPADQMSLQALKVWLRADPQRGRDAMRQNASYVFFRELTGAEAQAPFGTMEIHLTTGRSLAVDTRFHAIGTPVFVAAPTLLHAGDPAGFHRLMIAQDVGSAIRGPERGDIYYGSGDIAGDLAGHTKHGGNFFVLLPRSTGP